MFPSDSFQNVLNSKHILYHQSAGNASRQQYTLLMVSSLIRGGATGPITLGLSFIGMLFVQAMLTVASHRRVTMSSLAEIRRDVLAQGSTLSSPQSLCSRSLSSPLPS